MEGITLKGSLLPACIIQNNNQNKLKYSHKYNSSIVIEVIRAVYYYYFFLLRYFAQKNTQAFFKYLNALKKHKKEHKQLSFRCKAMNFCSNTCLKNIVETKCNE